MKEEKKRARAADKLAELFGLQEHLPTELPSPTIISNNKSREAEAVLAYMDSHKRFAQRPCKWCESTFASDRGNVAYCSDLCRQKALAELGILWNPNKDPRERWDFKMVISDGVEVLTNENVSREPLTVPPPALVVADLALEAQKQDTVLKEVSDASSVLSESEPQSIPIVYNL